MKRVEAHLESPPISVRAWEDQDPLPPITPGNRRSATDRRRLRALWSPDLTPGIASFGIRNRRSPAGVDNVRGGNRCAGLVRDGVCSQGWAPIVADQLGLDQGLVHRLGRDLDAFTGFASLEYAENLE
jgi:hypothetical protein